MIKTRYKIPFAQAWYPYNVWLCSLNNVFWEFENLNVDVIIISIFSVVKSKTDKIRWEEFKFKKNVKFRSVLLQDFFCFAYSSIITKQIWLSG